MASSSIHGFLSVNQVNVVTFSDRATNKSIPIALEAIRSEGAHGEPIPGEPIQGEKVILSFPDPIKKRWVHGRMKIAEAASLIDKTVPETLKYIQNGYFYEGIAVSVKKKGIQIALPNSYTLTSLHWIVLPENFKLTAAELDLMVQFYRKNQTYFREMAADIKKSALFTCEAGFSANNPPPSPEKLAEKVNKAEKSLFIRRSQVDPPLPRSLVVIPEGPKKGGYILLKSHGGMQERGWGGMCAISYVLTIETGIRVLFRAGRKGERGVSELEIAVNLQLINRPEYFVCGHPVEYSGPCRERGGPKEERRAKLRVDPYTKRSTENIPKEGFIMDDVEGGDLYDRLVKEPSLGFLEMITIARSYAECVACLHEEYRLVHLDQKPENVFLVRESDGTMTARLGDFGLTQKVGEPVLYTGTPGYIAPEWSYAFFKKQTMIARLSFDIWGMGCVFSELFHFKYSWMTRVGRPMNMDAETLMYCYDNPDSYTSIATSYFPKQNNPDHPDSVILQCLSLDPNKRPSAREVVRLLTRIEERFRLRMNPV